MYTWHDANYNKRLKLTIDGSKIKEDLYNFPIMIHLSNSSGITKVDTTCVFDELEDNSKKIALYTAVSSSDTQCYVEVDYWSTSSGFEDAVLWTKIPTISSGTDLDLYLYYDKNVSDNSYVGHIGEYPAQQVWDSNFKAVYHLSQSPTGGNGCIKDSTGNNNDGTPHGNMTSDDLVDGQVGKALDFDGSDDYVNCGNSTSLDITSTLTLEAIICPGSDLASGLTTIKGIISKQHVPTLDQDTYCFFINTSGKLQMGTYGGNIQSSRATWTGGVNYYVAGTYESSTLSGDLFIDGIKETLSVDNYDTIAGSTNDLTIGVNKPSANEFWEGKIDEIRISNVVRSNAWLKATYYSFFDNLITYSTEEIKPSFIFSGYVKVNNVPVARTVYLYRRLTGELVGSTISNSSTGYFEIPTPYDDYHFVVILPKLDESYNIIAKDKIKYGD